MELLAHMTHTEVPLVVLAIVAGVCVGIALLAAKVFKR